jgi:hypothetical protein
VLNGLRGFLLEIKAAILPKSPAGQAESFDSLATTGEQFGLARLAGSFREKATNHRHDHSRIADQPDGTAGKRYAVIAG